MKKNSKILVTATALLLGMPTVVAAQKARLATTDRAVARTIKAPAAKPNEKTGYQFSKASHGAVGDSAAGEPPRQQSANEATDASEAAAIKEILSGRPYGMTTFTMSADFCTAFFKDFRAQKDIRYISPIVVTDDYDDPVLAPYKSKCGAKLHMNEQVACVPRLADLPPERRRHACNVYYGTGKFRMYHADMDNDPSNGKEYVFYAQVECGPQNVESGDPHCAPNMTYSNGFYKVIDFKQCKVMGGVAAGSPGYNYEDYKKENLNNLSGVIKYQSDYYIYNLSLLIGGDQNPANPNFKPEYMLELSHYGKTKKVSPKMLPVCSYSTIFFSSDAIINGSDLTEEGNP